MSVSNALDYKERLERICAAFHINPDVIYTGTPSDLIAKLEDAMEERCASSMANAYDDGFADGHHFGSGHKRSE